MPCKLLSLVTKRTRGLPPVAVHRGTCRGCSPLRSSRRRGRAAGTVPAPAALGRCQRPVCGVRIYSRGTHKENWGGGLNLERWRVSRGAPCPARGSRRSASPRTAPVFAEPARGHPDYHLMRLGVIEGPSVSVLRSSANGSAGRCVGVTLALRGPGCAQCCSRASLLFVICCFSHWN